MDKKTDDDWLAVSRILISAGQLLGTFLAPGAALVGGAALVVVCCVRRRHDHGLQGFEPLAHRDDIVTQPNDSASAVEEATLM